MAKENRIFKQALAHQTITTIWPNKSLKKDKAQPSTTGCKKSINTNFQNHASTKWVGWKNLKIGKKETSLLKGPVLPLKSDVSTKLTFVGALTPTKT